MRWRDTVAVDPTLRAMDVTLCVDGASPGRIVAPGDGVRAAVALRDPRALPGGAALTVDSAGMVWPHPAGGCVRYGVDLAAVAMGRRVGFVDGATAVVPVSAWLWRPATAEGYPGDEATVRMNLPAGVQASAPWPVLAGGGRPLDRSALAWEGYLALGAFAQETVRAPGVVFNVAKLGGTAEVPVAPWLTDAAGTVALLLGHFPVESVQVILVPGRRGGEPVDFGLTSRGGGASVLFVMDPGARDQALTRDWVAVHEFVHLAHPVLEDDAAWLREGLATYYQEVLLARAGRQSAVEAWRSLVHGMGNGAAAPVSLPLGAASAAMNHTHSYLRVYWSGVVIALRVDVALRRTTGGRTSLDTLFRALATEAGGTPGGRAWTADEVAAVFDRAAGSPVWSTESARWLRETAFPEYAPLLQELGVRTDGGDLSLDPAAPLAGVRDAIMAMAPAGAR